MKVLQKVPMPLVIVGTTLLVVMALFAMRPKPSKNPSVNVYPLVQTIAADASKHRPIVTLYGRVESPHESKLASTINAYVDQVLVQEGDIVKADEIIVQLEDSEVKLAYEQRWAEVEDIKAQVEAEKQQYQADLKALQAEKELLALAKRSMDRYNKLLEKKLGSEASLDDAKQRLRSQELSLSQRELAVNNHPNRLKRLNAQLTKVTALRDQAALDLARTRVTAPFDGRVTAVNVSPGNRVRPGDVVITMFDVSHVEVRAQIPSRYLSSVERALSTDMELDASMALNDDMIPLRLERMAGSISQGQGGVDALFSLEQKGRLITLGRAGEVYLHMPPMDDSLALPPTAIYGQERIYSVEDGALNSVKIERLGEVLMNSGERWQLVRAKIPDGTPILVTQLSNAVGGLQVTLDQRKPIRETAAE